MKNERNILIILTVIWLFVIFGFSNQNAVKSLTLSDKFTMKIVNLYCKILNKNETITNKRHMVKKLRFYVRKTAHFTLYLILGLLVGLIVKYSNLEHIFMISILFCFIYAISDEIHQNFVENRTPKVIDVFIDTAGSFCGVAISSQIYKKKNKIVGK